MIIHLYYLEALNVIFSILMVQILD